MKIHALSVVLFVAVAFGACASGSNSGSPLVWKEGAGPADREPGTSAPVTPPADSPQATRKRVPKSGETIQIPEAVMADLMRFVNRVQVVLADRIEVDASRIPFQVAMVPVVDPKYVDAVEMTAPELKATGILLRSRVEIPTVEADFCRLRVGDGIDLVAGREIQVRTYNAVDPDRPAFLKVRAFGHAVYSDPATGRRLEKHNVIVECEIVREGGEFVFRRAVR